METMTVYHDEIEIEDMEYDEETETYSYPCPCGDRFQITKVIMTCLWVTLTVPSQCLAKQGFHIESYIVLQGYTTALQLGLLCRCQVGIYREQVLANNQTKNNHGKCSTSLGHGVSPM